ncbi:TRAF-like [Arabidopsis thaliana x Arabidopsis arenosa]|uniref:TRAF-like n=1 Tax=Arabidopsis thaliana x Arabidopsis arenosa TaxID=1240361 RepID=A0A8T2ADU6_9BRAS|nr:TRAF-like [Arabidopsis thaliana x Arabidopsis arenosa]
MGQKQVQRNSSFRFQIDNFSKKEAAIKSQTFMSHGCEWFLCIYPKGDSRSDVHLPMYLHIENPKSLGSEWTYQFVLLNQSNKELYRSPIGRSLYCAKSTGWGFSQTFPHRNLRKKGFLEKDRLIVEVYISRVEVVSEKKKTVDINGFQVLASQVSLKRICFFVTSARKIFTEHPDIAEDFKPKNQVVKKEYMNVLLNLVETLNKPSQNHSETELSNAESNLSELMEQGFKLEWLKSKLDEVSLMRKKADADVQQLDERVKNLELMNLDLKTKLEEVSLERKKSDDADTSRVQQLEECFKNLEMVVLDLKVKLGKEEAKSSADGFLLVDEPSFRFEIDNFSEKEIAMVSKVFVSGGHEWYLGVYPMDEYYLYDNYLSVYLHATNSKPLGSGWQRTANFYFLLLNQSNNVLYRSYVQEHVDFHAESLTWGIQQTLPLSLFQEEGYLENDKLIVEVYIQIVESFDGEREDVSEKKETVDINGFQVLASQVTPTRKIFAEHPDLAVDFKLKNQVVRTEYMNVLLNLIETLNKPSQDHSETELSNAHSKLSELTEAGFKLEWLKSQLGKVSLKRKKPDADVQQVDERVKNEMMKLDFKLDCLKTKIEEVSLERKKSDDADGSRVKEMEGRIKNLEMMVSDLKAKLGKEKAISSDDGFLLIN